ncbi:hypothetical protein H0E87_012216, partial [Populus deltoides]
DLEAKLGPLEFKVAEKVSEESNKVRENGGEEPIKARNKGSEELTEVAKINGEKSTRETIVEDKIGNEKSTETINMVGEEFSSIQA